MLVVVRVALVVRPHSSHPNVGLCQRSDAWTTPAGLGDCCRVGSGDSRSVSTVHSTRGVVNLHDNLHVHVRRAAAPRWVIRRAAPRRVLTRRRRAPPRCHGPCIAFSSTETVLSLLAFDFPVLARQAPSTGRVGAIAPATARVRARALGTRARAAPGG